MRLIKIIAITGVISIIFTACIKEANIHTRIEKPILVIEGSITTDSVPYTVKLTWTGPYKYALDIPKEFLEENAHVIIKDDLGKQTTLAYKAKGTYETVDTTYVGQVGRSYSIVVELNDGRKYISVPEKINSPVPLGSYKANFVGDYDGARPAYLQVSVGSKDPASEENYYRWTFYSWIMRQTWGESCGNNCIIFVYCYQKVTSKDVHILSDASINGNEIRDKIIGKSYIYTFGNHFIDIGQQSLTREAYQFWEKYDAQVSRTGSTLDPLPAPVKGNVYNAADPSDIALGYFFAASVTHKRAILIPYNITQYFLDLSATHFIPEGFIACFNYFPDALSYPPPPAKQYPPPPGWQNADTLKVYW